jgi:signal transduction histidine kinase
VGTDHKRWGGYMVVLHDITGERAAEQGRDEFVSVTSHELRTPLAIAEANLSTALLPGYAKMEPKATELVRQAHQNILNLIDLTNDLSTLSQAERRVTAGPQSVVDLNMLVKEMARNYASHAAAKKLDLAMETHGQARHIYTSESELREILQNLITNAVKYTEKGSVALELTYGETSAEVAVRDTGIGIAVADQARLFSKFFRAEDERVLAVGGTGLGLYISHKLADRLGMHLTFISEPDKGSTFTLKIPYRLAPVEAEDIARAAQS